MRIFTLLILFSTFFHYSNAQDWSLRDLAGLTFQSGKKISGYLSRKGFVFSGADRVADTLITNYNYQGSKRRDPEDSAFRFLNLYQISTNQGLTYQTSSSEEAVSIIRDIESMGFLKPAKKKENWLHLYQKNDVSIIYNSVIDAADTVHSFRINRNLLPPPSSIKYAEDLLVIQSHEQLRYIYGDRNIKKDKYYFSPDNYVPCSVLYPNTSQQAIFLWDDADNFYRLSFLLIGGGLNGENAQGFNEIIGHNTWHLKNGLRTGMSIQELKKMNGNDFSFYGSKSEFYGIVVPEEGGNIDFKTTGFKLNCLNCYDAALIRNEVVSADRAIADNRRLYVNAIILYPVN